MPVDHFSRNYAEITRKSANDVVTFPKLLLTVTMGPKSNPKAATAAMAKPKPDIPTDRPLAKESTELVETDTVLLKHRQAVQTGW